MQLACAARGAARHLGRRLDLPAAAFKVLD
jgi:hypothetical protein